MGRIWNRNVLCGKLFYPLLLTCFIFVAFQFYLFLVIGNMRNDFILADNNTAIFSKDSVHRRHISFSKRSTTKPEAEQGRGLTCLDHSKETLSAFKRAKTNECKELILKTSCLHQHNKLYTKLLKRTCPTSASSSLGKHMGCYRDSSKRRLLLDHVIEMKDTNSPDQCINHCLRLGFSYAGVEYGAECHCGLNTPSNITNLSLPQHLCDHQCPKSNRTCGGYYAIEIFQTGFSKFHNNASYVPAFQPSEGKVKVKVLFMLTLSGRALRQVLRLLKTIYRPYHYYLIHVDQRQEYLHRELQRAIPPFSNIMMSQKRFSTIWGGASLLEMLLSCMTEASAISSWSWDYFINLSESDYPIKTIEELDSFLTINSGKNFLKSHGKNTARFIQRQGLDMLFIECENRMWRLGSRTLQSGINIDGGSDWIGLHRSFVTYLLSGSDQLLNSLKSYWKYSLLPAESFFHTVLQNGRFCRTLINNNLHLTNWRRKQGCHCQYKHVVDWCGCSPNDYRVSDFTKLQSTRTSPEFFARKFEAIINQDIINLVDEHLLHKKVLGPPSVDSFWLNLWNNEDTQPNDLFLTFLSSLARVVHSRCSFSTPLKIINAHLFKRMEKIEGMVVTLKVIDLEGSKGKVKDSHNGGGGGTRKIDGGDDDGEHLGVMEAMFSPINQNYNFLHLRTPSERINYVEVGTQFDPKEEIFRNYLSIFGPQDDLVLAIHVVPDQESEATITVELIDPSVSVVYTSSVAITKGVSIVTHTSRLEKPLRPGTWMVKTREEGHSRQKSGDRGFVVRSKFLVLPLSHHHGGLIGKKEAVLINGGPFTSPNEEERDSKQVLDHSTTGRELDDYIDHLISSFWNQASSCLASTLPTNGQHSLCRVLPPCKETYWSTFYPDPKSSFVPPGNHGGFR